MDALVFGFLFVLIFLSANANEECEGRSCYPTFGNLLIGRPHKLSASSTCGLRGPERYCIPSSSNTTCYSCDSRQTWNDRSDSAHNSHLIENVVTRSTVGQTKNWWQSKNGDQNVSIRLDLNGRFYFIHLNITFRSPRPAAMLIEKSNDYGRTWSVYRYFAEDCDASFPGISKDPPKSHEDVICTQNYSDTSNDRGFVFKVLSSTENQYAQELVKHSVITNLRIKFTKFHTVGEEENNFYAIYKMVVYGTCLCHGHAKSCTPGRQEGMELSPDMIFEQCACIHNTQGDYCHMCKDFYNDAPWKPAMDDQPNQCKHCKCNGHSNSCHFSESVFLASGNVSGGVCDDCVHNTQGKNCEECKFEFFRDPSKSIDDPNVCKPCNCDSNGSVYTGCDITTGQCVCKSGFTGIRCDTSL